MDVTLSRILSLIPRKANGDYVHGAKKAFAERIGLKSTNLVTEWEAGRSKSYEGYVYQIAAKYGVTPEWLRGESEQREPVQVVPKPKPDEELLRKFAALDEHGQKLVRLVLETEWIRCRQEAEEREPVRLIPHYLTAAAAGFAAPIEGEDFELIELPEGAPPDADYCVGIDGDSMEPWIADGSMVYVKRGAQISELDVGIFFVDGDVLCKQWMRDGDGGLLLLSANPARRNANRAISKEAGRNVVCLGRVLGLPRLPLPDYLKKGNEP